MKTVLATLVVCLWASMASAAVAHVSSDQGECGGAARAGNIATTCSSLKTKTFTYTATNASDAILFSIGCAGTATPSAVTLTATGWTATQIGAIVGSTTNGFIAAFKAYSPNTTTATFTMTWTTTGNCAGFMNDLVDEFSGADATNFVDASNSGTGASGCTLSVTPVTNNDGLWFACNDSVTAVGGGFTKGADDTQQDWSEWKILSGGAGGAQASSWTSSGAMAIFGVAIKPSGGAAATPNLLLLMGVGKDDAIE